MAEELTHGSLEEISLYLERIQKVVDTGIIVRDGYPKYWGLYTREELGLGKADTTPLLRTPYSGESKKIHLDLQKGFYLKEIPIPKYRYNNVPNYKTEAERLNIQQDFAYFPSQAATKTNNKTITIPEGLNPLGSPWQGCYCERKYLSPTRNKGVFFGKVLIEEGLNLREGAGTQFDIIARIVSGARLIGSEIIKFENSEWMKVVLRGNIRVDGWVATKGGDVEYVDYKQIETGEFI